MAKRKTTAPGFTTERDALSIPLSRVLGAIDKKRAVPALACVLLQSNGQELRATGSNLEMEFQAAREWDGPEFAACVQAHRLHQVLEALPAQIVVELPAEPGGLLTVRAGRGHWTVPGVDPAGFPEFDYKPVAGRFFLPAQALRAALGYTKHAMAKDDVRYYLNGMQWRADAHRLTCTASDGHRMAEASTDIEWDDMAGEKRASLILPRFFIPELVAALPASDEQVVVKVRENSVSVDLPDGVTLAAKLIEGRYPEAERVWPRDCHAWCDVDREACEALIRRVIVPGEKSSTLRLTLDGDGLALHGDGPEGQIAEDGIPVAVGENTVEGGFNGQYLLDALRAVGGKSVQLKFGPGGNTLIVRNPEVEGVRVLIMGLRL